MQIDCYGFEATSQWFKRRTLDPYLIKRSEGITYLCFGNQLNRPIHRIDRDENGSVRQLWAFGVGFTASELLAARNSSNETLRRRFICIATHLFVRQDSRIRVAPLTACRPNHISVCL